jgi:hypothetical protein
MGTNSRASALPLIPSERIQRALYLVSGEEVLDADLAALYGVTTSNLNQAVKRNRERFPEDFMFQLTTEEAENLKFQFGISSSPGGRRHLPYAFIVQGAAMPSKEIRSHAGLSGELTAPKNTECPRAVTNVPGRPNH